MTTIELIHEGAGSATPFELQMLMALPCGCVVADFRARSIAVELVSLEAKGPHCMLTGHLTGGVLGLGGCLEADLDAGPGNGA